MPANQRHQTTQAPPSPTSKATAKYTNKDGSKFITVQKTSQPSSPSEQSPTMAHTNIKSSAPPADAPAVNRKKQKRREKQAAKLAAAQTEGANGVNGTSSGLGNAKGAQNGSQFREEGIHGSDGESGAFENGSSSANGYSQDASKTSKKKKKSHRDDHDISTSRGQIPPPPPTPPASSANERRGMKKEKIWSTNSQEERERIKEFWLSLGEDERKSLVKVEKDAVLKKMKEQQKHSCSCTVCGRKRLAIEEELEVLYDAYYEELEQYANNREDPPLMRHSRRLGAMSGFHAPDQLPPTFNPSRGRIENPGDEDGGEDEDEEYSDEDDEEVDDYDEDEPPEDRSHANDFFNFGNSLQVKAGGILTVADDLLKNDGKKFIEMMEQLAERRMQREEDLERQYAAGGYHANGGIPPHHHSHAGHNHPPPPQPEDYEDEDEDDEEEEEDEYDDEEDDEFDDEEMASMTEEQRMEEGRRMFQIFAARMFEQRVLTAYKEKVAKERQRKLFEELEEEDQAEQKRKEKKAKEAQKRKEKAQIKKQAQAEEKARKEAEEAEKAAALRAEEEKKAEENRVRLEEKRKRKEAQKKAEEEERLRKEAEKQKRIQEQKERQAEAERKQREAKERVQKEREEARLRAQEAKEAKDREARQRKERQENERKEKEAKAKEAQKQAEKQKKLDEQAALAEREEARKKSLPSAAPHTVAPAPPQQHSKRLPQQPISIPVPPGLQPHPTHSPQVQVAMPILPKAPTPVRPRNASQQHENVPIPQTPQYGSGHSQDTSPAPTTPQQSSPSGNRPLLYHPQAVSPMHAAIRGSPGPMHQMPAGMHPMQMNGYGPAPPMMNQIHPGPRIPFVDASMFAPQQPLNNSYRSLPPGIPLHPPQPPMSQGRGFAYPPPGFPQQPSSGPITNIVHSFSPSKDSSSTQTHSRNASGSFENGLHPSMVNVQPSAKPTPIARPSSVNHGQRPGSDHRSDSIDVEELTNHLGSSALMGDSDEPFPSSGAGRRASVAPGMSRAAFSNSGASFMDSATTFGSWSQPTPYGSLPAGPTWGNNGWGNPVPSVFNSNNSAIRAGYPRSITLRRALCKAYQNLASPNLDRYVEMPLICEQVCNLLQEMPSEKELLEMCETEGTPTNGGGYFDIRTDDNTNYIKHTADEGEHRLVGAPGEIGSPIVGSGGIAHFGGRYGPPGAL